MSSCNWPAVLPAAWTVILKGKVILPSSRIRSSCLGMPGGGRSAKVIVVISPTRRTVKAGFVTAFSAAGWGGAAVTGKSPDGLATGGGTGRGGSPPRARGAGGAGKAQRGLGVVRVSRGARAAVING